MAADNADVVRNFEAEVASLRSEILAHCYRMLGSWDDAEDAVQETYVRGYRAWDRFERRASPRTWLHSIATNVCLNAARDRARRALPSGIGAPAEDPGASADVLPAEYWIQPFAGDRADLRLALVASMQTLPATQRAVLILRDVLGFSAADVAEMFDMSVPAVKSALQRARRTLADAAHVPEDIVEPSAPAARRLLDTYVKAFETAQVHVLAAVLRADATLELVPARSWYAGKTACLRVLTSAVGDPGDWRMSATVANGQPAVAAYLQGEPFGLAVLDTRRDGIAGITVFGDSALVDRFTG